MPLILNNKTKKLVLNTNNNILKEIQKVYLGSKLIYTLGAIKKTGSFLPTLDSSAVFVNKSFSKDGVTFTYGDSENTTSPDEDLSKIYTIFDKNLSTNMRVSSFPGIGTNWFVLNLGKSIVPTKMKYSFSDSSPAERLYTVLGSVDGINWDTIWSANYKIPTEIYTFNISCNENLIKYQYIKFTWEGQKGMQSLLQLYDFQITEWYEEE